MFGRKPLSSFVKGEELTSTLDVTPAPPPLPATVNSTEDKVQPFKEPDWVSEPFYKDASLEVTKNGQVIETIEIGKKQSYVFGRNGDVCDIILDHPSASRKHAAIVHHTSGKVYLIDLQSGHGTLVDGLKVKPHAPMTLKVGTTIQFGASSRVYKVTGVGEGKPQDRKKSIDTDKKSIDGAQKRRSNGDIDTSEPKRKAQKTEEPTSVRCSHILVKHKGSRNPSSWKQSTITRSKEEAIKMIKGFREQILSEEKSFEEIARVESDCSSAKHDGDLRHFTRGKMQKPFEDASFNLQVGELSDVVSTDSGVHIILRTE